eukprot:1422067-Pleurochrysis_carterae.AAC.1
MLPTLPANTMRSTPPTLLLPELLPQSKGRPFVHAPCWSVANVATPPDMPVERDVAASLS